MRKSMMLGAVVALGFVGWQGMRYERPYTGPLLQLKEERLMLEYTATSNEAVLVLSAEAEHGLDQIEIRNPHGDPVFKIWAQPNQELSLQGFVVETRETTPAALLRTYGEGIYDLRGRTDAGQTILGSAVLSHVMAPVPTVVFPSEGARNVSTTPTVVWHRDAQAKGYQIVLEQGDNDGLTVLLPAHMDTFKVPEGILRPNTPTMLEVGAISANGNCTLVEVNFWTH